MSKRNFWLLQILIVSMMVVCLLSNTFAWSDRGKGYGNKLELDYSSTVNGTSADIATTEVYMTQGDYWAPLIDENTGESRIYSVSAGEELRFRTIVHNHFDGAVPCNVSLFLDLGETYLPDFTLRVIRPTCEERVVSYPTGWIRVFTSCHIDVLDVVDGVPEQVVYEWVLIFNGAGEFTIDDNNIKLKHF